MSKDKKIPMGHNAFLPKREGDDIKPKFIDLMEGFYKLWRGLDNMMPCTNFMNFNVRGSFVTVYMQSDQLCFYINILHSRGYTCEMTKQWAIDRGYPDTDYYCRIGPYQVRLALYNEKIYFLPKRPRR